MQLAESSLAERVVLVTGGGGGLGAAVCRALADCRAIPVIADVRPEQAQRCAHELSAKGATALALELDVGIEASVASVFDAIITRFGHVDAVINNAAIDETVGIDELEPQRWEQIVRTNLTGPYLVSRAAVKSMKARRRGHIVNIASTASKRAWPNASAYHATKWGLLGLSHALHAELRPHGIKVSAVVAGGMRTPFLLDRFHDIDVANLQDPASVARAVCFVLTQPEETVIPEIMVLPMRETSWP
jgi:NAD(P)-dependent dehydrogenase (short-subunit alcohol dehydrogenase family)